MDGALLFAGVKKQMAQTYLMRGGRADAPPVLCALLLQASGILFALVLSCRLLSPSPPLSPLSSARSQPRRRQEVSPCHSAPAEMSAGSPSQITPPTVRYLKKSRILFVWNVSKCWRSFPLPRWISHLCKTADQIKGEKQQINAFWKQRLHRIAQWRKINLCFDACALHIKHFFWKHWKQSGRMNQVFQFIQIEKASATLSPIYVQCLRHNWVGTKASLHALRSFWTHLRFWRVKLDDKWCRTVVCKEGKYAEMQWRRKKLQ